MRTAFILRAAATASLALLVACGALAATSMPAAAEQPRVPEEISAYFSAELIPRLVGLYGPGTGGEAGIDFDETTKVGPISRVRVWTEDFRAGAEIEQAVELSNNWVAPVTSGEEPKEGEEPKDGAEESEANKLVQLGLATVWINPHTNVIELAHFTPSQALGPALAGAPEGSVLVHDADVDAWYALADEELTLLAQGTDARSGTPISLEEAQQTLWKKVESVPQTPMNSGFVLAGLALAFVVVLLAVFVLVPERRRIAVDPETSLGFPQAPPDQDSNARA